MISGSFNHLPREHFYYVASPYTLYKGGGPWGWASAHVDVVETCRRLTAQGLRVYSPIIEAHLYAAGGLYGHCNAPVWQRFCADRMQLYDALLICDHMDGWETSVGVQAEIKWFEDRERPMFYVINRAKLGKP